PPPTAPSPPYTTLFRSQHGTAHAAARPAAETVLHVPRTVAVADAHQIPPGRVDPQLVQRRQRPGHESLAADLVDRAVAGLGHDQDRKSTRLNSSHVSSS